MQAIKSYRPEKQSVGAGQVLQEPYEFEQGKLVVREMTDLLVLDLVEKGLATQQMVLTVGYDIENLSDENRRRAYRGEITIDRYGRKIPKQAHGTIHLGRATSSTQKITEAVMELFDRIVHPNLLIRRFQITAENVVWETSIKKEPEYEQLSLFMEEEEQSRQQEEANYEREKRLQHTMIAIKKKYGKNAILKGMNLQEGATAKERNQQIGGHKA
jgi:DNA polymerase V